MLAGGDGGYRTFVMKDRETPETETAHSFQVTQTQMFTQNLY